jgi:hypothetical protein
VDHPFEGDVNADWMGTLQNYYVNTNVLLCPAAKIIPNGGANTMGTTDKSWLWVNSVIPIEGGYGFNAWLYSNNGSGGPLRTDYPATGLFLKQTAIESPSKTPVFMDANWINLGPIEVDSPARNLYTGGASPPGMARCTIARHGGQPPGAAPTQMTAGQFLPGFIDIGMADGHAEAVQLNTLWNYNWHFGWQVPATRPP